MDLGLRVPGCRVSFLHMPMTTRAAFGMVLFIASCQGAPDRSGEQLQIRLTTSIASYSPKGTAFQARVIGSVLPTGELLPRGTIIRGIVRAAHSVGLGIRRERAFLKLDFQECQSTSGETLPCEVELVRVDNARETVRPGNEIIGILAASHPHSWLNGIWYRPAPTLLTRAVMGLTGTAGTVQSRLAPNPIGAGIIFASRLIAFRMPDPEIELPAGTELIVQVRQPDPKPPNPAVAYRVDKRLSEMSARVTRPEGASVQDRVHLAFTGSQEDVAAAFEAAGWLPAQPRTARAVARVYGAFASMNTYATAPVSPLLYEGSLPDLVFQKSLNSISKRHHIRIWKDKSSETPMFLAAATHDVGIALRWDRMEIRHEIDQQIDRERTKVINDLTDAGCVAALEAVERPGLARTEAIKGGIITDGHLYVIRLKSCRPRETSALPPPPRSPQRSLLARGTRRVVLETRQYLIRGNVFYWGFRSLRSGFKAVAAESQQ